MGTTTATAIVPPELRLPDFPEPPSDDCRVAVEEDDEDELLDLEKDDVGAKVVVDAGPVVVMTVTGGVVPVVEVGEIVTTEVVKTTDEEEDREDDGEKLVEDELVGGANDELDEVVTPDEVKREVLDVSNEELVVGTENG